MITGNNNRLINESSPYLQQHASNPVDWYPWCDEAFERAAAEDKPIFLSIGYSSCHWCHVMEHETFESMDAASCLRDRFISIKVDREERPDVDHLYMEACVSLTGSGGWPLTIFMTPDKKPFFAGTYFPLDRFLQIAENISRIWKEDRDRVNAASDGLLSSLNPPMAEGAWNPELPGKTYMLLQKIYDKDRGGFGGSPKFPSTHTLMFLQRYGISAKNENATEMARNTLEKMSQGGLFDHVGGGFFRYSTDAHYLIPHFEKMLYDNAMLLLTYTEFGYMDTANRILDFCLRELYAPEGAFYTALDADSEGEEGRYYLFTEKEVDALLGKDSERYRRLFDISAQGNFEGKNLPNLLQTGPLSGQDDSFAQECHQKLLNRRNRRVPPLRDEKILLSSNSLMLAALATHARLSGREDTLGLALSLAGFLTGQMQKNGRYYTSYNVELGKHPATSEDYAYLSWGLLKLHQATLDERWLNECDRVCGNMLELFADDDGLLWMSGGDVTDMPARTKSIYDGALPSGNSIAAGVCLRLFLLTGKERYRDAHYAIRNALSSEAERQPTAYTALMSSVLLEENGLKIELPHQMDEIRKDYYPFATFKTAGGSTGANVCTASACLPPVGSKEELINILKSGRNINN